MTRKIDFDIDEVIKMAMDVFWVKGYENTSMKDLMEATGLLKGSLYNTFGSKEELYLKCLEQYGHNSQARFYNGQNPADYLKKFFQRLVNEGCEKSYIKGCLIMNSCLEFGGSEDLKAKRSTKLFDATESNFKKVLLDLISEKDDEFIHEMTVKLITAAFSIREISKFRKDKKFLKQIANNALLDLDISI